MMRREREENRFDNGFSLNNTNKQKKNKQRERAALQYEVSDQ